MATSGALAGLEQCCRCGGDSEGIGAEAASSPSANSDDVPKARPGAVEAGAVVLLLHARFEARRVGQGEPPPLTVAGLLDDAGLFLLAADEVLERVAELCLPMGEAAELGDA